MDNYIQSNLLSYEMQRKRDEVDVDITMSS
jgi:hypothetical protein